MSLFVFILGTTMTEAWGQSASQVGSVVKLDKDGALIVNGKRILVYGTYRDPSDNRLSFDGVREAGFNLTHTYYFESLTPNARPYDQQAVIRTYIAEATKYLDAAHAAGVGVFLGLPREVVRTYDKEAVRQIVSALCDKPALWLWYMMDEPTGRDHRQQSLVEAMNGLRKIIEEIDPNHPVCLVEAKKYAPYRHSAHLMWVDYYTVPKQIRRVYEAIEKAKAELPGVPVWAVLQGHDLRIHKYSETLQKRSDVGSKLYIDDRFHRPGPKELKAQVHTAFAADSMGVVFYWMPQVNHDMKKRTPRLWQGYVELGSHIRELEPVLLSSKPRNGAKVKVEAFKASPDHMRAERAGDDPTRDILTWQRVHEGKLYVGVVNAGYYPYMHVTLELPFDCETVSAVPGDRKVVDYSGSESQINFANADVLVWKAENPRRFEFMLDEADVAVWCFTPKDSSQWSQ